MDTSGMNSLLVLWSAMIPIADTQGASLYCDATQHQSTGDDSDRWVDVLEFGSEIIEDKREVHLTARQASDMFGGRFPSFASQWQDIVGEVPESTSGANKMPDGERFQELFVKREGEPKAQVTQYSNEQIIVKILRPLGYHLWHRYYECLASFRIDRGRETDIVFQIDALEKTFGRQYKGIKQGTTTSEVLEVLGAPSDTRYTQAAGFYFNHYREENITIVFKGDRVFEIREGVSKPPPTKGRERDVTD